MTEQSLREIKIAMGIPQSSIVFFRTGDSYAAYGRDAVVASAAVGIERESLHGRPQLKVPLTAMRHVAMRLIALGKHVAQVDESYGAP